MNKPSNKTVQTFVVIAGLIIVMLIAFIVYRVKTKDTVSVAPEKIQMTEERKGQDSDTMTVTVVAYCPCAKCNEQWAGLVCTGHKMKEFTDKGINICATDPTVIPLGSKIIYDDKEYLATDVGAKIKGKVIDILFPTHKEADDFGVKKEQTILVKNIVE